MNTGNICSRQLVTVPGDMSIIDTAQMMCGRHVGALVVVNSDRRGIGIITDRDLALDLIATGRSTDGLTVGDLMHTPLVCCQEKDSVTKAVRTMRKHGIRRLPVLNESQDLQGMFTLDDAVDHLGLMLGELIGVMKSEFNRERNARG